MCVLTLLATAFLTASLLLLRPPRANHQQWAFIATVIVAQGALTLVALAGGPTGLRYVTSSGAVALGWIGASSVYSTMSGPHVEGYALVLGSAMVVQALLTLAVYLRRQKGRTTEWQNGRRAERQKGGTAEWQKGI